MLRDCGADLHAISIHSSCAAAVSHPCWSHEKAHPHPAPGCHRDPRASAPCPLARAARKKRRRPLRPPATSAAPAPATAAPFPQSAKYIADMKSADGKPMVIGIAVDGTEIAAYACNGTDDEAWFFGNQKDGKIDITSRFKDTLKAEFDGKDVVGDLTMNGVAYKFSAPAVPAPAGMYTAELERRACILGGASRRQRHRRAVQRRYQRPRLRAGRAAAAQRTAVPQQRAQQAAAAAGPADQLLANRSASSTINGQDVTPVSSTATSGCDHNHIARSATALPE